MTDQTKFHQYEPRVTGDNYRDFILTPNKRYVLLHDAPLDVEWNTLPFAVGRTIDTLEAFPFPWPKVMTLDLSASYRKEGDPMSLKPALPFIHTLVFRDLYGGLVHEVDTTKFLDESELFMFERHLPGEYGYDAASLAGLNDCEVYLDVGDLTFTIQVDLRARISFDQSELILENGQPIVKWVNDKKTLNAEPIEQQRYRFALIGFTLGSKEPINYRPSGTPGASE